MAAWVAKRLGGISFDRMGRYFGRDGSTLVRDVAQLEKLMEPRRLSGLSLPNFAQSCRDQVIHHRSTDPING
jgi:hypothetical protein